MRSVFALTMGLLADPDSRFQVTNVLYGFNSHQGVEVNTCLRTCICAPSSPLMAVYHGIGVPLHSWKSSFSSHVAFQMPSAP